MKTFLLFIALCCSFSGFSQAKLGYLDAYVVLYTHPKFVEANETLDAERQEFVKQVSVMRKQYNEEYNRVEGLIQAGEVTEEEKEKLLEKLTLLEKEIQDFMRAAEVKIKEREVALLNPVADEIEEELQLTAKERGADILFQSTNSEGVSVVLDAHSKFDFTIAFGQKVGNPNYDGMEDNYYPREKGVLIGFTDIEKMLVSMPKYRAALDAVTLRTAEFDKELNNLTEKFSKKLEEYSAGIDAASFTEQERNDRENELIRLQKDIKDFMQYKEVELQKYQDKLINPLIEELDATIKETKQERQLTMVINQTVTMGGSTILFGDKSNDITALLMEKLEIESDLEPYDFKPQLIEKIGVVEIERILEESEEFRKLQLEMKDWKSKESVGLKKDSSDLVDIEEKWVKSDSDSKEKWEKMYDEKEQELKENGAKFQARVREKEAEMLDPFLQEIQAAIDAEAAAGGYQLVVNKTSVGTVWYVREDWEITDKVIARMK